MVKQKKVLIDGKPVIFKSKKNTPSINTIKDAYAKIPDDKKIPVVFETKTQYLNEYIRNQEKKKNIDFTPSQERAYKKTELRDMKNIVSRYTTKHNPYIEPRVVFFTDTKMPKAQFEKSVMHEYGHELWEKNPKIRKAWSKINTSTSPTMYGRTDRQEDFAESFMLAKTGGLRDPSRNRILSDSAAKNCSINTPRLNPVNKLMTNFLKPTSDFSEFDVNGDGKINDYDMNILRQREKQLIKDTRGRNSVADATNQDIPEAYLFTEEWKLYGGPKNYNPRTRDSTNLTENIHNITSRHIQNLRENTSILFPPGFTSNIMNPDFNKLSIIAKSDQGIMSDVAPNRRKLVKNVGRKTFYTPQGREGEQLQVYKTTKQTSTPFTKSIYTPVDLTPETPRGRIELDTLSPKTTSIIETQYPLLPKTGLIPNNLTSEQAKTYSKVSRNINTREAKYDAQTQPTPLPRILKILPSLAAKINFRRQGIQVYEDPQKLRVYHSDYPKTLKKINEPAEPKTLNVLGLPVLHTKVGDWLNYAEQAKKNRDEQRAKQLLEEEQQQRELQLINKLDSQRMLPSDVSRELRAQQLLAASGYTASDLSNNFGVIRAGSTYTPYPIEQKRAFVFDAFAEKSDPNKTQQLLSEDLYSNNNK